MSFGFRFALFIMLVFVAPFVGAQSRRMKPLFEAGFAGGAGYIPDYPAAGQSRLHGLVFPVFQFRGEVFRSDDEDGTRARLFRNSDLAFDVSFGGAFPADSTKNEARRGMDDLDWIGEMGPRLHARLFGDNEHFVRLSLAARMAFSTDFTRMDYRGLVLAPSLSAEHRKLIFNEITVGGRLSPQLASRELHEYLYSVRPEDATAARPEYNSKAGYIGTNAFVVFAFERPVYQVFAGFGASFHDGAANAQSPLFKDRINETAFAAFRWFFYRSEKDGHI